MPRTVAPKPDGLVEVLGQDHPRAREEGRLERRLGHELAADVVVHVALGVGRHNGKRSAVAEEGLRGEAVQAGAGAAADGEERRLWRLRQDVGHVVQRGDLVRDVAGLADPRFPPARLRVARLASSSTLGGSGSERLRRCRSARAFVKWEFSTKP